MIAHLFLCEATNICFDAKEIYTPEILATVLQQLVDQSKLPTLLLRSIIQSVTTYRDLSGFVNSILMRLIMKKIWTYPKLWDGFIRCCTVRLGSFSYRKNRLINLCLPRSRSLHQSQCCTLCPKHRHRKRLPSHRN